MAATMEVRPLEGSYFTALYLCVTALLAMLVGLLFYVLCSRRYKLNWFEKNQLAESEKKETQLDQTQVVIPNEVVESSGLSKVFRSQSIGRLDNIPPCCSTSGQSSGGHYPESGGVFWVPPSLQRQASVCQSDGPNDLSGEDSVPDTPNTPLGLKISPFASGSVSPNDKAGQVVKYVQPVIAPSCSRPRVASMYSKLDHTKIDTAMYGKDMKPEPQSPSEAPRGSVQFGLSYNREFSLLCVHVFQVRQLLAREFSGAADPYIKVRLLPDRISRQSSVHRKTLNPTFDEEFVFDVPEVQLAGRTVELLVFDYDQYSRHECMGHVLLPLEGLPLQEKRTPFWKAMDFCQDAGDQPDVGQLMFSLGYLSSAERLTVVILKARDLKVMDEVKKTTDPYVKVALIFDGKRLKKKKTSTLRANLNPVFNEALTFNITKEQLKTISLEFMVVHDNLLGQNETLGSVLLGPDSKGAQAEHLHTMISSKGAVAMWHSLIPVAVTSNSS